MGRWTDGRTDGWTDRQTDWLTDGGWIDSVISIHSKNFVCGEYKKRQ